MSVRTIPGSRDYLIIKAKMERDTGPGGEDSSPQDNTSQTRTRDMHPCTPDSPKASCMMHTIKANSVAGAFASSYPVGTLSVMGDRSCCGTEARVNGSRELQQ